MKSQEIALAKSGMTALLQGDAHTAHITIEKLVATGAADAVSCIALAYVCRVLQDVPTMHAAIKRALALKPRNLRALILKVDRPHEANDSRSAAAFYITAVKSAAQLKTLPADQFPNNLSQALDHAQARCNQYALNFAQFLTQDFYR